MLRVEEREEVGEDGRECGGDVDEEAVVVELDELVEAVVLEREGVRQWKGP